MSQSVIVRSALDVQRAHDVLANVILDDDLCARLFAGVTDSKTAIECLKANCNVLCWLLGHRHNNTFERNLVNLLEELRRLGYALVDSGELRTGPIYPQDS